MNTSILIVVDMQNDFIDGSLGTPEAVSILPNVIEKIKTYKANHNPVIFTRDTHPENYLETMEGKKLPVIHCIKDTLGWQLSSKLPIGDSVIIDKPTFGSTALINYIQENYENPSFELIGLCTDICVVSNALLLKAFFPETTIKVDASCCAGVSPKSHDQALATMQMCHIDLTNMPS